MTAIRRLDHVAIVVRDTEAALRTFGARLGLGVAKSELLGQPHVRLTYLDVGNSYLQLVEPLGQELELARWLEEHGEGLHHVCFAVDDPLVAAAALAPPGAPAPSAGGGRGRVSVFVPGDPPHGVRLECTEFRYDEDVRRTHRLLENR
jgi:methylmalonyl-CoA/ethylmalonyl-CoA epimerase